MSDKIGKAYQWFQDVVGVEQESIDDEYVSEVEVTWREIPKVDAIFKGVDYAHKWFCFLEYRKGVQNYKDNEWEDYVWSVLRILSKYEKFSQQLLECIWFNAGWEKVYKSIVFDNEMLEMLERRKPNITVLNRVYKEAHAEAEAYDDSLNELNQEEVHAKT